MEVKNPAILEELTKLQSPSAVKLLGTYAEVYASLFERAQLIGHELIVRGAIPILQMRWRIGPDEAIMVLDDLMKAGYIIQRDGWRAIALLTKTINDQTQLPVGMRKPTSAGQRPASTDEPQRRELPASGSPVTPSTVPA